MNVFSLKMYLCGKKKNGILIPIWNVSDYVHYENLVDVDFHFPLVFDIPASESMHGLDNSQNEEVSEQTSPVGFHPCIHWHCSIHCHYTGEHW
jgi:hypothetical protein